MEDLVGRLSPSHAAVESPFHGRNAHSALQLAHARGVVLAVLAGAGLSLVEYAPAAVKKAVSGNGNAEKRQIQYMVGRVQSMQSAALPADAADAVAVALCHVYGLGVIRPVV